MITIVPRSEWGARPPRKQSKLKSFTNGWFVHWLGTPPGGANAGGLGERAILRSTQAYHMDPKPKGKGWNDIAYSFAVGQSGTVYELRGWGIAGGHTEGYNSTSMAVVFLIGEGQEPTLKALAAAAMLIRDGVGRGYPADRVRPHRAVKSTACPGDTLAGWVAELDVNAPTGGTVPDRADSVIRLQTYLASAAEGVHLGSTGPNGDGVDGDFGPKTINGALWLFEERLHRIHLLEDELLRSSSGDLGGVRDALSAAVGVLQGVLDDLGIE